MCAELLPERIALDEWGFPLIDAAGVPQELLRRAHAAAAACPARALRLASASDG